MLDLTWTGGEAPFTVQQRGSLGAGEWEDMARTMDHAATVASAASAGFLRVIATPRP